MPSAASTCSPATPSSRCSRTRSSPTRCGSVWPGSARIEVPVNNGYLGDMLRYLVQDSRASVLVIAQRFLDRLAEVARRPRAPAIVVVPDATPRTTLPDLPFPVLTGDVFFAGATPADDLPGPDHHDTCAADLHVGHDGPVEGRARAVGRALPVRHDAPRRDARATAAATTPCTRRSTCRGSRRSTCRPATAATSSSARRSASPSSGATSGATASGPPASSARWPRS